MKADKVREAPDIAPNDFRVWVELDEPIGRDGKAMFFAWWTGFRVGSGPMVSDGEIHAQVFQTNVEEFKARQEHGVVMWNRSDVTS